MTIDDAVQSPLYIPPEPSRYWRDAHYRPNKELDSLHRHNVFIAALPTLLTLDEATKKLCFVLNYNEDERLGSPEARCLRAQKLFLLREPLSFYYDFYLRVYGLLLNGYAPRNPFPDLSAKQFKSGCANPVASSKKDTPPPWPDVSLVLSLLGFSGVGKSCMGDMVLKNFPQVINHRSYMSRPFDQKQIVWMRLECPSKGSLLSIEMDFFRQIDDLLGTKYHKRFTGQRLSRERLLIEISHLAKRFKLGVLAIDEIQRLFKMILDYESGDGDNKTYVSRKSDPRELLEFLIRMSNTLSIPLIFIGTGLFENTFPANPALARRFSQAGAMGVGRLMKDSSDWDDFLAALWRYQYTTHYFALTKKLKDAFYEETQGIISPCVSLYIFTQMEAIWSEKPVSVKMVKKVAKMFLKPWQVVLKIHRAGLSEIVPTPEIEPIDPTLENYKAKQKGEPVLASANDEQERERKNEKMGLADVIMKFLAGTCSQGDAQEIAQKVLKRFPRPDDKYQALKEAMRLAEGLAVADSKSSCKDDTARVDEINELPKNDLRQIAGDKKKNESVYEKFKKSGVFKGQKESGE